MKQLAFYWNPLGAAALLGSAAFVVAAAFIFFRSPGRPTGRRLALVLWLEGWNWAANGLVLVRDDPTVASAAWAVVDFSFFMLCPAYIWFLATLPSPLSRPLAKRPVLFTATAFFAVIAVVRFTRPEPFFAGVAATSYARLDLVPGPLFFPLIIVPGTLVFLYGFATALAMWRTAARETPSRSRGALYALAFGARDIGWVTFLIAGFVLGRWNGAFYWGLTGSSLTFLALLTYGMLKHQLLDLDLRLKWTVRRGTVAGVFLTAFVLGFALAPLQRAAEKLAERAVPGMNRPDSKEVSLERPGRDEIYRDALRVALRDATLTRDEELRLHRVAEALGIGAGRAHELLVEVERQLHWKERI